MVADWLSKNYDFSSHVIAITGGAGVLGSAMTGALLEQGAKVAVLTRSPDKAAHLIQHSGQLFVIKCDVTDRESIEKCKGEIEGTLGRVTALINAAGGNQPGATTGPDQKFFDLDEETIRSVLDLNLMGTILPSQVFARDLARAEQGSIINISSMAALRPMTRVFAYAAAKAGIDNFTKWLAVHIAKEYSTDVRVNAIAPGFFLTEQNRFLLIDKQTGAYTERGKSIIEHTPMGRFGVPEDLVGTLFWLLSPASRFVTGSVIPVDGGFSAFTGV